jgi:hypothetical protein
MAQRRSPSWLTALLRAPAYLYDWGLGVCWGAGSCGSRMQGAAQGAATARCLRSLARIVLAELFVMVGLGRSANWYRNVKAGHGLEIAIAQDRFHPAFRELEVAQAAEILAGYELRNRAIAPVLRRVLSWLVGSEAARAQARCDRRRRRPDPGRESPLGRDPGDELIAAGPHRARGPPGAVRGDRCHRGRRSAGQGRSTRAGRRAGRHTARGDARCRGRGAGRGAPGGRGRGIGAAGRQVHNP